MDDDGLLHRVGDGQQRRSARLPRSLGRPGTPAAHLPQDASLHGVRQPARHVRSGARGGGADCHCYHGQVAALRAGDADSLRLGRFHARVHALLEPAQQLGTAEHLHVEHHLPGRLPAAVRLGELSLRAAHDARRLHHGQPPVARRVAALRPQARRHPPAGCAEGHRALPAGDARRDGCHVDGHPGHRQPVPAPRSQNPAALYVLLMWRLRSKIFYESIQYLFKKKKIV